MRDDAHCCTSKLILVDCNSIPAHTDAVAGIGVTPDEWMTMLVMGPDVLHEFLRTKFLRTMMGTSTFGTAGCGPACPVVWEGKGRDRRLSPIPIAWAPKPLTPHPVQVILPA